MMVEEAAVGVRKVAVIVGPGSKWDKGGSLEEFEPTVRWGLGGALALKFAHEGYHVALLARRVDVSSLVVAEILAQGRNATAIQCDVASDESVVAAFQEVLSLGNVEVLVFNGRLSLLFWCQVVLLGFFFFLVGTPFPEGTTFATLPKPHEINPEDFTRCYNISVTGCVRCVQQVVPGMLERGKGSVLLSGATMSIRGGAKFSSLAPAKFALRALGQSMFQEYAPQSVHVAHVLVDGVIDSPGTRAWGEKVQLMNPADVANVYWHLHTQPSTVWSYEMQVGPKRGCVGMRM